MRTVIRCNILDFHCLNIAQRLWKYFLRHLPWYLEIWCLGIWAIKLVDPSKWVGFNPDYIYLLHQGIWEVKLKVPMSLTRICHGDRYYFLIPFHIRANFLLIFGSRDKGMVRANAMFKHHISPINWYNMKSLQKHEVGLVGAHMRIWHRSSMWMPHGRGEVRQNLTNTQHLLM